MYLHLGSDVVVSQADIIAILDLENTSTSKITRNFLAGAQKNGYVIDVSLQDLPRSYVICASTDKKNNKSFNVYISPLSAATLTKRSANNKII